MTRKKNKKSPKKEATKPTENTSFVAPEPPPNPNYGKKDKAIDIANYDLKLEKAKEYSIRIKKEYPNSLEIPWHLEKRKPTLKEFEAISTHCMGNLSEMSLFLDCSRQGLRDFIKREENKDYYEILREGKLVFNDFAVSKLKENIAGVRVLSYGINGPAVYDRPPDTKAIEFALRNNKSFEEWEWQNTSKTQNTNLNIDVNQLIQSQLEKMDINELKQYTKSLLNDIDIKGLIE